jgi:hypothetical protein
MLTALLPSREEAMAQYAERGSAVSSTATNRGTSVWVGWIAFAGTIMVMLGGFHIIQGLVALFNDEYFLVSRSGLVINVDFTAWGWVHVIAGLIVLFAGICVFAGQMWARLVGVILALVSAVINLGFLAAYPIWSLMMIALDVAVIMALTVHGSDVKADA